MRFLVPIVMLCAVASIAFVFTVNRQTNGARTTLCVIFPVLFASFAWNFWSAWHTSSGNEALQYSIAFVLACITLAAMLTALGRRVAWLRHHKHDGWNG